MAIKKQRLDKYYNLAKEKGYRARSAFKLLELNRKYAFLQQCHVAVDLCAAPGGWMQILAQEMPTPRKIIGIDLDPIKPLGRDTISFVGDITTVDCRRHLVSLLDNHPVDIFVHDGAPNFGASKDRDVFVQNDLVLHALKLSTEFLKKDGIFVSKVFRSENFSKIINIFEKLFDKVDVTKPMSSRMESAEIFAVCRGFKDPEDIDPSLFDSGVVFEEKTETKEDYIKIKLSDFIRSNDSKILDSVLTLIPDFECDMITDEMKEWFEDVKLISKADKKKIYKFKQSLLLKIKKGQISISMFEDLVELKEEIIEESTEESESKDKIDALQEELDKIHKINTKNQQKNYGTAFIPNHGFYEDRLFDNFEITEKLPEEVEDIDGIEVESCSDSMEMTESEMKAAIMLKDNGYDFIDATVDRYLVDSEDIILPCEKRVLKIDEPKLTKKKVEYMSRKKARATRRTNKLLTEIQIEDEEEEAVVYKKVYKSQVRKQKPKPRVFLPKAGGLFLIPKGKGKLKFLDRRMKHDLRIQKIRERKR